MRIARLLASSSDRPARNPCFGRLATLAAAVRPAVPGAHAATMGSRDRAVRVYLCTHHWPAIGDRTSPAGLYRRWSTVVRTFGIFQLSSKRGSSRTTAAESRRRRGPARASLSVGAAQRRRGGHDFRAAEARGRCEHREDLWAECSRWCKLPKLQSAHDLDLAGGALLLETCRSIRSCAP
jgi:hypothetical protein